MLFNKELGVALCWDGSQNGTKEHMTRFFPEEWIDLNFEFADRLSKLKLSFEEIALIRAIVLTSAGIYSRYFILHNHGHIRIAFKRRKKCKLCVNFFFIYLTEKVSLLY
jgi:hypothetical protein